MKHELESSEELWFSWYLDELKEIGIVINYTYEVKSIVLNTPFIVSYIKTMKKVADKILNKTIIPKKVYTADFKVEWSKPEFEGSIFEKFYAPNNYGGKLISLIEVKGNWDNNNMTRLFKQNQAIVWEKYKVFVQLVKVPILFKATFTPERYLLTDKLMKPRKIKFKIVKLNEFLLQIHPNTPRIT